MFDSIIIFKKSEKGLEFLISETDPKNREGGQFLGGIVILWGGEKTDFRNHF